MKETVAEASARPSNDISPNDPKETPHERKRRLARDRQRRHREKLRRNAAGAASTASPVKIGPSPRRPAKPTGPGPVSEDSATLRARDVVAAVSVSPLRKQGAAEAVAAAAAISSHVVGERVRPTKPAVRASSRPVRPDNQPPVPLRRSNRHASPSEQNGMSDSPLKQTRAGVLPQSLRPHQMLQQQQLQQQQQKRLQQQQQHAQQQREIQDQQDVQQAQQENRQQQLRAHHQQRQKFQQQRQTQYNNLLLPQHQTPFATHTHGFTASTQPQASQAHQQDAGFGFSTQGDGGNSQAQYVASAQRAYLQDPSLSSLAVQTRPFMHSASQQRNDQQSHSLAAAADAAAGLTALPSAVNGMHGGLAGMGLSVTGPSGSNASPTGLGMTAAQATRFAAASATQHGSPEADVGNDTMVDTYAHDPNETPEERKRRLARERQRRRRKRLKEDPEAAKDTIPGLTRTDGTAQDDPSPATVLAKSSMVTQVRGSDNGLHGHTQVQMGAGQFESGTIGAGHQVNSALHPIQVTGVGTGHDEIGNAVTNRAGFSAQTIGPTGVSTGIPSSSVGLLVPPRSLDLQRFPTSAPEVREVPVQNETPEQRKRRLARDRQRRRRSRLKRDKLGLETVHKSPSSSQGRKAGADSTPGRMTDNVDQRISAELDRPVMASEGLGDSERMPIGSPGSAVFRAEVAPSLSFGDQQRTRASGSVGDGGVPNMGMNFGAGTSLGNLQVQVSGLAGGTQSQGGMHWSQAFDSEPSARYAVENAVSAFRAQMASLNPSCRAYVLQQGVMMLSSGSDYLSRDMMSGALMSTLRSDGVIRM